MSEKMAVVVLKFAGSATAGSPSMVLAEADLPPAVPWATALPSGPRMDAPPVDEPVSDPVCEMSPPVVLPIELPLPVNVALPETCPRGELLKRLLALVINWSVRWLDPPRRARGAVRVASVGACCCCCCCE